MPLINWSPELSVFVKEFDAQHQNLVNILNELYEAMKDGRGREQLGEIFKELLEYTQVHFSAEEKLMLQYHYPEYEKHKAEHVALIDKVLDLQKKFQTGNIMIGIDTMTFLRIWLFHHILETDRNYGAFFNSKGIL